MGAAKMGGKVGICKEKEQKSGREEEKMEEKCEEE